MLIIHDSATPQAAEATLAHGDAASFEAAILQPREFGVALRAVGNIARTTYEDLDEEEWLARVIDPIVSIHPDGVAFEAFSGDASTLAWLHCGLGMFAPPNPHVLGCTHIDYSNELDRALTGIGHGSHVVLHVEAQDGVRLAQSGQEHHEPRIDLPDGWLRGFGETHAGLLQATLAIDLTRADLLNILREVQRKVPQRMKGRALHFELRPGEAARVRIEPWNSVIRLQASPPRVDEPRSIKVYGRRRLSLIGALIPLAQKARVWLIDDSRPTYWELQLPTARFILGLSGWTARKFTASFVESLRGASAHVSNQQAQAAARLLADAGLLTLDELAEALGCEEQTALGAGLALCRQGLAIFEPERRGLRWRPIAHLPFNELSGAVEASTREENAALLLLNDGIEIEQHVREQGPTGELHRLSGQAAGRAGTYTLQATLAADGSFVSAACTCAWMTKQRGELAGGPCKHLLALRMLALRRGASGEIGTEPEPKNESRG